MRVHSCHTGEEIASEAVTTAGRCRVFFSVGNNHVVDCGAVDGHVGDSDGDEEEYRNDPMDWRSDACECETEDADDEKRCDPYEPCELVFDWERLEIGLWFFTLPVDDGTPDGVGNHVTDGEGDEDETSLPGVEVPLIED